MKRLFTTTLLCFPFFVFTIQAKKATSVTINPIITKVDSLPEIRGSLSIGIADIKDTFTQADSFIIGNTRMGPKKNAPILCKTRPADIVKASLHNILNKRTSTDNSQGNFTISIVLNNFSLKETYGKVTQTLTGSVSMTVTFQNSVDTTQRKVFTVNSEKTRQALDTTKFAETVLRAALENCFIEMINTLNREYVAQN